MPEHTEHDYVGPHGLRVRGTVLVVPGRGETAHTYVRFGARLAADAYRERVLAAPDFDADDIRGCLDRLAEQVAEAIAELESSGPLARPLVLIGSDSGAAAVGALLARAETAAACGPRPRCSPPCPATAATRTAPERGRPS